MATSPRAVAELPTPALLLDADVLEANLARMQARCDALGVALRPHAKTHKSADVARRQAAHGARGLTVATLAEARYFADAGWEDLTWAFPVVLSRLAEARALAERVTLRLLLDTPETVAALAAADFPFHVFLEVDSGQHRSGVDPGSQRAVELARRLADHPRLVFDGLLTHSGHAYRATSGAEAAAFAEGERRTVVELAERLRAEGIEVRAVSVGSTPAMSHAADLSGVDEARPGNYVFHDGTQAAIGSCGPGDAAVTVLTSVVSSQPGGEHSVIDAGALALSKDPGPTHLGAAWSWAMGAVFADLADYRAGRPSPRLRVTGVSQEHGIVSGPLPVGARLRVLPNHSCLAVPNFDFYWVVRGEEVVDRWPIHRGRD